MINLLRPAALLLTLSGLYLIESVGFAQSNYSVSRGRNAAGYSRNYNQYYGTRQQGYVLNPWLYYGTGYQQPRRPVPGEVQPYSELDYGRIVESTLAADSVQPSTTRYNPSNSILAGATASVHSLSIGVDDVLDRGIIQISSREEVRLRGVIIPSEGDVNDVQRLYAREAITALRRMLVGQQIRLDIVHPQRDSEGRILANITLANGANLNQWILANGYGTVRVTDFNKPSDGNALVKAENAAKAQRLGVWSGR